MASTEHLQSIRRRGGIIVLDGAMGTELEARGAEMDSDAWCGLVNLSDPRLVREVHEDHIRAGADVVITNTFMSGLGPMQRAGVGDRFDAGIENAVKAAREAVRRAASRPVAVAGSVGATPWGRPPADPDAGAEDEQLRGGYARQVRLLADAGVDLVALEMVTDARLGRLALEAALASGLPVWVGLSMRRPGRDPSQYESLPAVEPEGRAVAEACLRDGVDAVNVMHTDIGDIDSALGMVRSVWGGPIGVYPHHGRWERPHWTFVDVSTETLAGLARGWIDRGATMLGGCCGLRTHHVAVLREIADTYRPG